MGGFGSDPFGSAPFGHSAWSRTILFDYLPGIYKTQDEQNGGDLEALTDALRVPFDQALVKIRQLDAVKNALLVPTDHLLRKTVRLGKVVTRTGKLVQRGLDGVLTAGQQFESPTARFSFGDIGRTLAITNSIFKANNRVFKIVGYVSRTKVILDPPPITDSSPLVWILRSIPPGDPSVLTVEVREGDPTSIELGWFLDDGLARHTVAHRRQFDTVREERVRYSVYEGVNAEILSDGRVRLTQVLNYLDVGRFLVLSGFDDSFNNGKFEIKAVDSTNQQIVDLAIPSVTLVGADTDGHVTYVLRPGAANITVQHVVLGPNAPLLVAVTENRVEVQLASDFVSKSISTAAAVAAAVAGAPRAAALVTATAGGAGTSFAHPSNPELLAGVRLDPEISLTFQSGTDGFISALGPPGHFQSASGVFTASDVGRTLRINNASSPGNVTVWTVASIVSPTHVTVTGTFTGLDTGISWELVSNDSWWAVLPWLQIDISPTNIPDGVVLQEGFDGALVIPGGGLLSTFRAQTAVFDSRDIGRLLHIKGSTGGNSGDYIIANVDSNLQVEITPAVAVNESNVTWQVRSTSSLPDIESQQRYQYGVDGTITASGPPGVFTTVAGKFTTSDIGRQLEILNSATATNLGIYTISAINSVTQVQVSSAFPAPDASGNVVWRVLKDRDSQQARVLVSPPTLMPLLTSEVGLTTNTDEVEVRQRSYAQDWPEWIDTKGHPCSYVNIARTSGFDATVKELYRVSKARYTQVDSTRRYEVGYADPGRSGNNGSLYLDSGLVKFRGQAVSVGELSAVFYPTDIGSQIDVGNSANTSNNGLWTILDVLQSVPGGPYDVAVVDASDVSGYSVPENGLGPRVSSLTYTIVKLYADRAPLQPRFDDVNPDLMQTLIGECFNQGVSGFTAFSNFDIDSFCWTTDFKTSLPINVTAVSALTGSIYEITAGLSVPSPVPDATYRVLQAIATVGRWSITDSAGNKFYVETLPVNVTSTLTPAPTDKVQVFASASPVTGVGTLTYECPVSLACDYCKSYRILITITPNQVLVEQADVQKIYKTLKRRLETEVKPFHAELIYQFNNPLDASLSLSASVIS